MIPRAPPLAPTHTLMPQRSSILSRAVPLLGWIARYERAWARDDVIAGLTTAVMLVPQGMAYAMLAGLPPIHGLYASILPLVLYAIFGTARSLAVGPVALDSLVVGAGLVAIVGADSPDLLAHAILLAAMAGAMQVVMGGARLGFLVNFLSRPVITGFSLAAALIIAISQLSALSGIEVARGATHQTLWALITSLGRVHLPTLTIGTASVVALVVLKRYAPRLPRALIVVAATTIAVWALGLHEHGVSIVGEVPAGLPSLSLPELDMTRARALLTLAITLALMGFAEAIAIARALEKPDDPPVEPNRELIAIGLANLSSALSRGYSVTGSFSRSAVYDSAGARTPLAGLVTAITVAIALVWLTPLLTYLPHATLAAIIIVAVSGLIDGGAIRRLWRTKRSDLALLLVTAAATLALGIQWGLITGVAASIGWMLMRSARPHFAVLGRIPGTDTYRNVANYPEAITIPGVIMARMDAQFYFGNVAFLRARLDTLIAAHGEGLQAVILDASAMNQLDSSASGALDEIARSLEERGARLLLANVKRPVMRVLERDGYPARHDPATLFLTMHEAALSVMPRDEVSEEA